MEVGKFLYLGRQMADLEHLPTFGWVTVLLILDIECGQIDRFLIFGPLPGLPCRRPFLEEYQAAVCACRGRTLGTTLCVYWRPVQLYIELVEVVHRMASLGSAAQRQTPP